MSLASLQVLMLCMSVTILSATVNSLSLLYRVDKSSDSAQMIENLRSHIQTLDKSLKVEKDKNGMLQ